MLTARTRLFPNTDEVAAKVIDGEAILINLSTGMYYSLDGAGGLAWQLLEAGHTLGEIAEAIAGRFEVDAGAAAADLQVLAAALLDANLVTGHGEAPAAPMNGPTPSGDRERYVAPALHAYHDMAELLALDPPHPGLSDVLSRPLDEN